MSRKWWIVIGIVTIFGVYAILTEPEQSAGFVKTLWDALIQGLVSIGKFFDRLLA